jgi:hypothetical protein
LLDDDILLSFKILKYCDTTYTVRCNRTKSGHKFKLSVNLYAYPEIPSIFFFLFFFFPLQIILNDSFNLLNWHLFLEYVILTYIFSRHMSIWGGGGIWCVNNTKLTIFKPSLKILSTSYLFIGLFGVVIFKNTVKRLVKP